MSAPLVNQTVAGERNIFTGTGDIKIIYNLPPAEAEEHRNLLILLRRVEQFWVAGVLEKSVHHEALLSIDKTFQTEAVEHPWESVLELPDQTARALPPGKKTLEIFNEVGRSLLILGDPGSGKTISLLELTRDLIAHAKDDPSQPTPVVFNLSTWTNKYRAFSDWLAEELKTKYLIPNRTGRSWLEKNRLLLLLDGLDEVKQSYRAHCVSAINAFVQEAGIPGIVVCSRIKEYTDLPARLKFNGAVSLKPLTLDQVDAYLARAGAKLSALRATLQQDNFLQSMSQSPLMLSIMSVAYQGKPVALPVSEKIDTTEAGYKHVFDTYVERMFERRGKTNQTFPREQTKQWLSWLARRMRQSSSTIFLVEQLQPSWLSTRLQRFIYTLGSRVLAGLISGVCIAFPYAFFVFTESAPEESYEFAIITWLYIFLFMAIAGLIVGIRDVIVMESNINADRITDKPSILQPVIWISLYALIWVFLLSLVPVLSDGLEFDSLRTESVITNLPIGLIGGTIQWFIFRSRYRVQSPRNDVNTYETLSWSWSNALKSSIWGAAMLFVLLALIYPLSAVRMYEFTLRDEINVRQRQLMDTKDKIQSVQDEIANATDNQKRADLESRKQTLTSEAEQIRRRYDEVLENLHEPKLLRGLSTLKLSDLLNALPRLVVAMLIGGFIGALFGGLTSRVVELKNSPNQGMKLTMRNAVLAGGMVGSIIGLVTGAIIIYPSGFFTRDVLVYGAQVALIVGFITGVIVGLRYGGLDIIKHYSLRAMIFLGRNAPRNYPAFLDYAANLILLQKVGGGYIFIHRLLLEYFADLPVASKKSLPTQARSNPA